MTSNLTNPRRLDRPWRAEMIATVLGPLSDVTSDGINDRWSELLAALPSEPWLRECRYPVAVDVGDLDPVDVAARVVGEPWPDVPVYAFVGRDVVAVLHSHAICDGRSSQSFVRDLLTEPGSPLSFPALQPATLRKVAAAGVRYWGLSPKKLGAVVSGLRGSRAHLSPSPPMSTIESTLLVRDVGPDHQARLREARDRLQPTASLSSFLLGAFLSELRRRSVLVSEVTLPVDLRRYIAGGHKLRGNLAAVQRFSTQLEGETLDKWNKALWSGEPMARFLAAHARRAVTGVPRTTRLTDLVPSLGWSDCGHATAWDDLPWTSSRPRVTAMSASVWNRRIGVCLVRVGATLHLTCALNTAAFDVDSVGAALDASLTPSSIDAAAATRGTDGSNG